MVVTKKVLLRLSQDTTVKDVRPAAQVIVTIHLPEDN